MKQKYNLSAVKKMVRNEKDLLMRSTNRMSNSVNQIAEAYTNGTIDVSNKN